MHVAHVGFSSPRKYFRYSLRLLFVVMFAASLPLASFAHQQRQRAVAKRFHLNIRDAEMDVRKWVEDQPWSDVEKQLQQLGFSVISSQEAQYSHTHRVLVGREAWVSWNGVQHDLIADIMVGKDDGLCSVAAGLLGRPNMALAAVSKSGVYPKFSVANRCLSQPEVLEASKKYPLLKELEITYDQIRYHRASQWPFGFHITVVLGNTLENDDQDTTLYFSVASELDPAQGPLSSSPFNASFTVDEFRYWGGSGEW